MRGQKLSQANPSCENNSGGLNTLVLLVLSLVALGQSGQKLGREAFSYDFTNIVWSYFVLQWKSLNVIMANVIIRLN